MGLTTKRWMSKVLEDIKKREKDGEVSKSKDCGMEEVTGDFPPIDTYKTQIKIE
jgi:hypothetical protein